MSEEMTWDEYKQTDAYKAWREKFAADGISEEEMEKRVTMVVMALHNGGKAPTLQ